jgi:MFS family permease
MQVFMMNNSDRYKRIYPWVVVGLLWMVALLNYLDRQMLATMKSSMMVDIAELETARNFGRLMAIFLWIYGFVSPAAGLVADRVNRKWLIVGSLGVWSGVTFLMGFAHSFHQLYVLRATMGLSEALYIPAGLALIADYHRGRTRSLAIGIHLTGLYLGQALGGFGATVAEHWSWQQTFQGFGLFGLLYSLVLIFFLRENRQSVRVSAPGEPRGLKAMAGSLGILLGSISFWIILFYFATPSFPGWAVKNWMPTLFSKTLGIDMAVAGPITTITTAASSLLGVLVGGIISDRWVQRNLRGRIFTSAIGLSLTLPALFLIGYGKGFPGVLSGAILFGIGFGMFDTNNMPILCQFFPSRQRAAGYGLLNMAGIFAGAVITTFLGKSTDAGHLGHDMALLSIPVALALVIQVTFLRPKSADAV